MASVTPNPAPGYFPAGQTVSFAFDASVVGVASSVNAAPPSISKYIAYDTLTPANPFIAITQDGKGNVVYDGGFPKFYNGATPALGTPFSGLSAAFKYLYNALNFIANPAKVAINNKKVLFLCDAIASENYAIKNNTATGFLTSITNICSIAGYIPTFKDRNDYVAVKLDTRLAELEQYCAVVLFSVMYTPASAMITSQCVNDLVTFRENGNGIIMITDHGPILNNIAEAEAGLLGFFNTANKVAAKFGAYFTGNYDRTPVNVGFLRTTYGDHSLYANMSNAENIHAGASESKVVVSPSTVVPKASFGNVNISTNGINTLNLLVTKTDGSVETFRWVYSIQGTEFVFNKSVNPVGGVTETNVGKIYADVAGHFNMDVLLDGTTLGTIWGEILNGAGKRIGEVYYDSTVGNKIYWYAGVGNTPISNGENITTQIRIPFDYGKTAVLQRTQSKISGSGLQLPAIVKKLKTDLTLATRSELVCKATMTAIKSFLPLAMQGDKLNYARNLSVVRDFFDDKIQLATLTANIYRNATETAAAISAAGAVVPGKIFINAQNNLVWGYKNGTYQILTGLTAKDIFGAPRNVTNSTTGLLYQINTDSTIVLIS